MSKQALFLDALLCRNKGSRPPVWIMRQVGRYMPEYRAIRKKHAFLDMVHTPELAAEVTLLPIQHFGMDAAILFSDILNITESLGLPVRFEEGVGPVFDQPIRTEDDINRLNHPAPVREMCGYVSEAIKLIKPQLNVPLIGFCGAPFTVASYMIEGRSSRDLKKTKQWMLRSPESFHKLLTFIADASISYLQMQIDAGVDAIQLFDSWTNVLSEEHFNTFASTYHRKILDGIQESRTPTILFCRGSAPFAKQLVTTAPSGIGFDWSCSLQAMRKEVPSTIALQGNLDPYVLYASTDTIRRQVNILLDQMTDDPGFIFNLGHGILPDIPTEAVKTLVETIQCR